MPESITAGRRKLARKIYLLIENQLEKNGFPQRWNLDKSIDAVERQLEKAGMKP